MGASDAVEEALWWIGWHPRYVLSAAVAVGFVVGHLVGGVGTEGLVAGLVFAGGGLYSRRILASEAVVLGGAASVAYTVGFETALGAAGVSGVAETVVGLVTALVEDGAAEPIPAAQGSVSGFSLWYFACLSVGAVAWSVGAAVVNRTYADTYRAFRNLVGKKGEALLGEGTHTTMNGTDSLLGVRPNRRYQATNIRVRPNSIDLNYGSVLDMPRKAVTITGSTKHLYYDQLSSVDYDEPYFEVRMAGGDVIRVVTDEEPSEVLEEIETNLKRYKTTGSRVEEDRRAETAKARGRNDGEEGEDEASEPGEEAEKRAEEALEDIQDAEAVFEDAFNEVVEDEEAEEGESVSGFEVGRG